MAEKQEKKTAENANVPAARQEMQVASQMFTGAVLREMASIDTSIQLTAYQKKLAEHLFIQIDTSLKEFEAKREKENKNVSPYLWANINMQKLALSAMHRIELGLDALIPGTIYPIPYWNGKLKKYDLDLRIGYVGTDTYKRKFAIEQPKEIIYELVYSNDEFVVMKKGNGREVETYEFNVKNPFDRGDVVGGFGYIVYEDPSKNKLVIVDKKEFQRAKEAGKAGGNFWKDWEDRMQMKTVVLRTLKHVHVDPEKVNQSYLVAEEDQYDRNEAEEEIKSKANTGGVIDITEAKDPPAATTEPTLQLEEDTDAPEPCPNSPGNTYKKSYCDKCKNRKGCPVWGDKTESHDPKSEKTEKNGPGF